jgi:RecA/RadA recombinase
VAHLIPPDFPEGTSPGEALLFEMLRGDGVGAGWTVLHSLYLPEHVRQIEGEADFVILMPGLGALCVEVKSHLRADYVDGAWYLGEGASPDYRGPCRQAEMAARSVKKRVVSALPAASSIVFWPAVVFTHCVPAVSASTGDWHRWQLLTSADLERDRVDHLLEDVMRHARDHVGQAEQARWFDPGSPRPTPLDCEHIRVILRPDVHFLPATSTLRTRRREEIRRFSEEQLAVIDGLDGVNDRALVEGPAGTGKTVLAFEEARRAAATKTAAALLCFNQQLATYLRHEAAEFGLDAVDISTLHALMQRVAGVTMPPDAGNEYWSCELPDRALAALIDTGARYDLLIVDEAQDLATPGYLDVMDALLDGELSDGCWRMFADFERQAIYSDESALERILKRAPGIARFRLRRNCRNTPRIAEYIVRLGGLSPGYSKVLRPDGGPQGTPRTSFYSSGENQQQLLLDVLKELQASGEFEAEDIVILSPFIDSCAAKLARQGSDPPLEPLPRTRPGASSYGTVAAFKGLEAPAVVLTDIDEVATPRAQRLFYVGVSRATDRLRVLVRDGLQDDLAGLVTGGAES